MKNTLLLLALSVSLVPNLFAQTDNTAPVLWGRYQHSDVKVSVIFPKLPNATSSYDSCREELTKSAYAYAEGVVYELSIVASKKGDRPPFCPVGKTPFDQSTIDRRLDAVRQTKGMIAETNTRIANLDARSFRGERFTRLVIPDLAKKRWIELAVFHYADETPNMNQFFDSLMFGDAAGREIGDGAEQTLGDPVDVSQNDPPATVQAPPSPPADHGGDKPKTQGPPTSLYLVSKPQARYTDAARSANTQGTVRLKVTMMANGSVGTITTVNELKNGLTDRAINAARRLVFLPRRVEGKPVNSTITIEYSFSIY